MVFEWDQIYFSTVFDDLNIVKKVNMYSRYRRYIHEGKIRAKLFDLFIDLYQNTVLAQLHTEGIEPDIPTN